MKLAINFFLKLFLGFYLGFLAVQLLKIDPLDTTLLFIGIFVAILVVRHSYKTLPSYKKLMGEYLER